MRRLAVVAMLAVVACGGAPEDPASARSCGDLAASGVRLVEDYLEALEGQPLQVVTGEAPPPAGLESLAERSAALDERMGELGCDPDEINDQVVAGTADLVTDDPAGRILLDLVRTGALSSAGG